MEKQHNVILWHPNPKTNNNYKKKISLLVNRKDEQSLTSKQIETGGETFANMLLKTGKQMMQKAGWSSL